VTEILATLTMVTTLIRNIEASSAKTYQKYPYNLSMKSKQVF